MRRTFLSTRPSRAVYRTLSGQQPLRTFAAAPLIKDDSPPSPVVPSKEQAHPVGPFYEAILRTPAPLPKEKPENPPVTSQSAPVQTPKPTPEHQQSKPVAEEKKAAAEEQPAAEEKKPARRTRKPKQETSTTNSKAKSVPSSSSPSSSSSDSTSSPPTPGPTLLPQSPTPPGNESSSSSSSSSSSPSGQEEEPSQEPPSSNDVQTRASVVFASSLAGPAERRERLARMRDQSRLIAGVLVPPRPEEPDNCCMSGCVNCVWDRYRDEMEEWAARSAEAERRLAADEAGGQVGATEESMERTMDDSTGFGGRGMDLGVHDEAADRGAASMDEDGGGSVGNWETGTGPVVGFGSQGVSGKIAKDFWDDELYKNVPVGIREFMKQEKRLKEKHRREGTLGG
ncbi:oxidoreductase-like protein [Corynascus similis CBS 632.67]